MNWLADESAVENLNLKHKIEETETALSLVRHSADDLMSVDYDTSVFDKG